MTVTADEPLVEPSWSGERAPRPGARDVDDPGQHVLHLRYRIGP
ncbi:hypothetical protein ACWKSP_01350 [Micromonosporaceae bacterium Da 78-11]